jgi:hypothetical protein
MDLVSRSQLPADDKEVHVVPDHYQTRQTPRVIRWFARIRAIICIHADQRGLDQSGGALVCGTHRVSALQTIVCATSYLRPSTI